MSSKALFIDEPGNPREIPTAVFLVRINLIVITNLSSNRDLTIRTTRLTRFGIAFTECFTLASLDQELYWHIVVSSC